MTRHILLIEDDRRLAPFLKAGLTAENYVVEVARDGLEGLNLARKGQYSLLIVDRSLPSMNGLEICSTLRGEKCSTPILMLTAKDTTQDKIDGLRGGADDYITKPFAFEELLARIEALLRRPELFREVPMLQVGDLTIDLATKTASRAAKQISLTPREFALLVCLAENANTVVSRARLLNQVWGLSFDPGTKAVDVYIRYLRQKLDSDFDLKLVKTVRGFGYMLSDSVTVPDD
jgi:two-component system OmpR family response regulator